MKHQEDELMSTHGFSRDRAREYIEDYGGLLYSLPCEKCLRTFKFTLGTRFDSDDFTCNKCSQKERETWFPRLAKRSELDSEGNVI